MSGNGVAYPDPVFQLNSPLFDYPEAIIGKWYYWDEAEMLGGGPFDLEHQAREALSKYVENL